MEYTKPPLDERLYQERTQDDLAFITSQSGIHDPGELKRHILAVQKKAYDVYGHHCIRSFAFTRTKISTLPAYEQVLALGREREGAIFLDFGCCFGTDIRKVASDGFPLQNLVASDLWTRQSESNQFSPWILMESPFIPHCSVFYARLDQDFAQMLARLTVLDDVFITINILQPF